MKKGSRKRLFHPEQIFIHTQKPPNTTDWSWRSIRKTLRQKTGKKILLVVNARGGSNIKAWLPSAEEKYLDEAIRRTKEATKYGPLKGILWHQGESNSGAPQSYMKQLETMVGELRKQLDADNVPFVAGEIAPGITIATSSIRSYVPSRNTSTIAIGYQAKAAVC